MIYQRVKKVKKFGIIFMKYQKKIQKVFIKYLILIKKTSKKYMMVIRGINYFKIQIKGLTWN